MRSVRVFAILAVVLSLCLLPAAMSAAAEHGTQAAAAAEHGAAAEGHGEAAGHGGGVPEGQLYDLLYRIMNFAVLVIALVIVARKPLKQGLKGRSQAIAEELTDLETRRDEARKEYALLEKRIAEAEKEREAILHEYRALGEKEMANVLAEAQAMAERIKNQARFTIEQETAMAKAELRREMAEMSASLAEDLLREKITAEDQTRLVDEYLQKVGQEVQ